MRVVVGGKDIIEEYFGDEKGEYRNKFRPCLPQNSNGKYHVSCDGVTILEVTEDKLWEYPFVVINTYYNDEWDGVSNQGIALLAFELNDAADKVNITTELHPSFISVFQDRVFIIYRLENFFNKKAKPHHLDWLDGVQYQVANHLAGKPVKLIANPLSNKVDTYIFVPEGYKLSEIQQGVPGTFKKSLKTPEQIKEARATGGKIAASIRKQKSISCILNAVNKLKSEGKEINQSAVAEACGLSRCTVNRNWEDIITIIGNSP